MKWIRKRTHCHVPGHGTHCLAVWERGMDGGYFRCMEERLALEYEEIAEGGWETRRLTTTVLDIDR